MITTSMLKRQVWIADDDEFDHVVKIHKEYLNYAINTKIIHMLKDLQKSVMLCLYIEHEADAKFSLNDIWNLFQGDTLPNNAINFCRQMINCMKAWDYLQKTGVLLSTEIIKQTHGLMMEDEEDVLAEEYKKSPVFAGYHAFTSAGYVERYMEGATFRFHETKKVNPIMAATNLFGNIINIHPFEDGNGRIYRLILAHVLIQMKCCLFPVILSSFHRRGRKRYIRAVKTFDRKPSSLYTTSLIH